jgi:hypothetical protein
MQEFEDTGMPKRSIRLTFRFKDGEIKLLEREFLDRIDPPSDPPAAPEGESGFWVELRDADNRTVHRRIMSNPFDQHVEVHSPEGGTSRAHRKHLSGTFIVDLPDRPDAEQVALFSSAPPHILGARAQAGSGFPATEVARVTLR